jgi:hypothetical protein
LKHKWKLVDEDERTLFFHQGRWQFDHHVRVES